MGEAEEAKSLAEEPQKPEEPKEPDGSKKHSTIDDNPRRPAGVQRKEKLAARVGGLDEFRIAVSLAGILLLLRKTDNII